VPLGLEHGDVVDVAGGELEGPRVRGVEGDGARGGAVDAAEIDGELAIDEDPDVVVADELQRFAPWNWNQ
jgi:hypothetical protein